MPRLLGERIQLREYQADDLESIRQWVNDESTTCFLSTAYWPPQTMVDTEEFLQRMLQSREVERTGTVGVERIELCQRAVVHLHVASVHAQAVVECVRQLRVLYRHLRIFYIQRVSLTVVYGRVGYDERPPSHIRRVDTHTMERAVQVSELHNVIIRLLQEVHAVP